MNNTNQKTDTHSTSVLSQSASREPDWNKIFHEGYSVDFIIMCLMTNPHHDGCDVPGISKDYQGVMDKTTADMTRLSNTQKVLNGIHDAIIAQQTVFTNAQSAFKNSFGLDGTHMANQDGNEDSYQINVATTAAGNLSAFANSTSKDVFNEFVKGTVQLTPLCSSDPTNSSKTFREQLDDLINDPANADSDLIDIGSLKSIASSIDGYTQLLSSAYGDSNNPVWTPELTDPNRILPNTTNSMLQNIQTLSANADPSSVWKMAYPSQWKTMKRDYLLTTNYSTDGTPEDYNNAGRQLVSQLAIMGTNSYWSNAPGSNDWNHLAHDTLGDTQGKLTSTTTMLSGQDSIQNASIQSKTTMFNQYDSIAQTVISSAQNMDKQFVQNYRTQ